MQINKKLPFIDELVAYAEEIENAIPGKGAENSNDQDFFLYHLLHRMVRFSKAVVILAEGDFFHEVVLISRVELEGLACFIAYASGILAKKRKGDAALASKWRAAMRYEAFLIELERNDLAAASKLLNEYSTNLDPASLDLVTELINGGPDKFRVQKWHGHGNVHQLFTLSKDKSAEVLYNVVYHHFSEVVHWSPSGVVGEGLDSQKEAALNSTFHCLCDMTKYVNKIYPTKGLDYKLKNVYSRYVSAMRGDAKVLLHNFRLNEAK